MNTELDEKYKLYEFLEEQVTMRVNNYNFKQYAFLLESRNIAFGDTSVFQKDDSNFYLELTPYEFGFSKMIETKESKEHIANILTTRVINKIEWMIEKQIESNGFQGNINNFKQCIKLVNEGMSICKDDKYILNIGIGILM